MAYERETAFELLCDELVAGESTYDDVVHMLGVPATDYGGVDAPRELIYGLTAVSTGVVVLSVEGRYVEYFVAKDDH